MPTTQKHIYLNQHVTIGNDLPLALIAGPCTMESHEHALETAEILDKIAKQFSCPLIYKSSFDKANRTSAGSQRGIGMKKALNIFTDIKEKFNLPVITDIHENWQCEPVAEIVDILQIPAFLCRQTDLLTAAGKTKRPVNIKKGQFLAPWDMKNIIDKMTRVGNHNILLCERGSSFGYNTLISDMRSIPIMAKSGYPVVFDATHSVQEPGGQGSSSGGNREFAPILARAATAIGIAALFIETHNDPDQAPSDGLNMIPLEKLPSILKMIVSFDTLAKQYPTTSNPL